MSPPIYTPDGSEVSEIVLPDGSTASEVIGPDGNVVFEDRPDIPDSGLVHEWTTSEGSGTTISDSEGAADLTSTDSWVSSNDYYDGSAFAGDGTDNNATAAAISPVTTGTQYSVAAQLRINDNSVNGVLFANRQAGSDNQAIFVDGNNTNLVAYHYNGSNFVGQAGFDISGLNGSIITAIYEFDNGSGELYVNLNTDATGVTTTKGSGSDGFSLCSLAGNSSFADFNIGHCAVYNRLLGSTDRQTYQDAMPVP